HLGSDGPLYFLIENGGKESELKHKVKAGIGKGQTCRAPADHSQMGREAPSHVYLIVEQIDASQELWISAVFEQLPHGIAPAASDIQNSQSSERGQPLRPEQRSHLLFPLVGAAQ